jgi:hypothetical protein
MMKYLSVLPLALLCLATQPVQAKTYNILKGIPSESQALINRIQADMAAQGGSGEHGAFEGDCGDLNVGASTDGTRPASQVIIADKIINIGGQCRTIGAGGGVRATTNSSGQTTTSRPATSGANPSTEKLGLDGPTTDAAKR